MLNTDTKLLNQFKEDAPVVEEWSSWEWYDFFMKLQLIEYNNGQWVPPYNLQNKIMNYDGFNMGDSDTMPEVDLLHIYATQKEV